MSQSPRHSSDHYNRENWPKLEARVHIEKYLYQNRRNLSPRGPAPATEPYDANQDPPLEGFSRGSRDSSPIRNRDRLSMNRRCFLDNSDKRRPRYPICDEGDNKISCKRVIGSKKSAIMHRNESVRAQAESLSEMGGCTARSHRAKMMRENPGKYVERSPTRRRRRSRASSRSPRPESGSPSRRAHLYRE